MSIGGLGARQAQFSELPDGAEASQAEAAATEAPTQAATAQQADAGAAASQAATSQTAPAPNTNGQAMGVWQALQKDPQAQLLQEDLLLETDAGTLEDGVPVRSDDEVLDNLDEVWDNQDALYDELDQLTEGAGASSVDGLTPTEVQERMAEIQEELDFLYEYEDLLYDELDDPDLGFFDSVWTEWDLWDVKFDVADLEAEMADLQGAALDWSFDDLWSQFAGGVGGLIDDVFAYYDQSATKEREELDKHGEDQVRSREKHARLIDRLRRDRAKRAEASHDLRERARLSRSNQRPPTTPTEKLKPRLRGLRGLASDLAANPTRQGKERLRVAQHLVRGERS